MIVHPETKSLVLKLRQPELVQKVIPRWARAIDYEGHNMAVKFDLDVVRVLRNMGIKAPSPIRYFYDWPRPVKFAKVFDHQVTTAEFATLHQKLFILNEMGTSKTASALWAADYLMQQGYVGKVLVVSPLSTLELVWAEEIFNCLMHRTCTILHGSRQRRFDRLNTDANFYIVNHDGLKIIADEIVKRKDINLIIVDEAAAYRNASTARYKVLANMIQPWHRLWLMTGTPCPNSPEDAWALTKLVNPNNVPKYFGAWRRETMIQMSQYKWVPRANSFDMAYRAMQPAIRFKKSECLDLPPVTIVDRKAVASPEQVAAVKQIRQEAAFEMANTTISAVNAADKINKIRQIQCGAVKDPTTGLYHTLPYADRLNVLQECIEQAAAKVLVIVPFKGIIYQLEKDLRALWAREGYSWDCRVVNGDVSPKMRVQAFQELRADPNLKLLLCHPRVMAHGITATSADMLIFFAPIYSNEEFQQVMERINRPGQTRKMTIVRIGMSSLEWGIYALVDGRKLNQDTILDLYKQEIASHVVAR